MDIAHRLFDMFAFSVALVELIHLYREGKIRGRNWIVPMLIALLIGFGGIVAAEYVEGRRALARTEAQIVRILQSDTRTFDELTHGLPYKELPLASEALDDLISSGQVVYDDVKLSQPDDTSPHDVLLYHLQKPQDR